METILSQKYFKQWRDIITIRKYGDWCELHAEELEEQRYAADCKELESIYWCWNCKYSECGVHS